MTAFMECLHDNTNLSLTRRRKYDKWFQVYCFLYFLVLFTLSKLCNFLKKESRMKSLKRIFFFSFSFSVKSFITDNHLL